MLRAARLILRFLLDQIEVLVVSFYVKTPGIERHRFDPMIRISELEPWLHPEIRQQLKNRSHSDVISVELLNSCLRIATANQIIQGLADRLGIKERTQEKSVLRLLLFGISGVA